MNSENPLSINVYDFDGTIYNGDSTVDFWKFSVKRNKKILLNLPKTFWKFVLYCFGLCSKTEFKQTFFSFLKKISDIDSEVNEFWKVNESKIKKRYLTEKSETDLIISASPEFLLKPVSEKLGVRLIASRVDRHTGIFDGENCHDKEKVIRFNSEFPNTKINKFYSDSLSDSPLADISNEAFIVSGDDKIPWNDYQPSGLKKIKQTFLSKDFLLFVFCGGMGTLTNFICSLIISMVINPTAAYVFGYAISLFVAYALNAYLIFKEKLHALSFLKFVISYIPNFIILFAFVCIFLNIFGWNKVIVYALAAVFGIPVTFILVKLFAFKKSAVKGG